MENMGSSTGFDKGTVIWIMRGILVFIALVVLVAINPFVIIGPGERGVVTRLGAVQDEIKNEGLNFRIQISWTVTPKEAVHPTAAKPPSLVCSALFRESASFPP